MKYLGSVTDNKDIATKEYVDGKVSQAGGGLSQTQVLNLIYPVGAIFMSTVNKNPGTYLGGTWERWGQGRVPISVNDTDSDFNAANKTGGEKTHTLSTGEMPSHSHAKGTLATSDSGSHTHSTSGTASSAGGHEHSVSGTAASAGAHTHKGYYNNTFTKSSSKTGAVFSTTDNKGNSSADVARSAGSHEHDVSGTASSAGAHEHSVSGTAASAGSHTHTISGSTASAGSGNAHNNMPPYITCYMWRRTA